MQERAKIYFQSQPVYFFLGAVLEAISKSISPASAADSNDLDSPSVKFIYNDLPLDSNQKYSVPIPQPSKDQFESDKEALNEQIKDSQRQIEQGQIHYSQHSCTLRGSRPKTLHFGGLCRETPPTG